MKKGFIVGILSNAKLLTEEIVCTNGMENYFVRLSEYLDFIENFVHVYK